MSTIDYEATIYFEVRKPRIIDKYKNVIPLCENVFYATLRENYGNIVDAKGRLIVPNPQVDVQSSNGKEFVVHEFYKGYIVIDKDERDLLGRGYANIVLMGNKLYAVLVGGTGYYRIINRKNQTVSDYRFKSVKSIGTNLTVCTLDSDDTIIYENGVEIARFNNGTIANIKGSKDTFSYKLDNSKEEYIIVDKRLNQVVPGTYTEILFSDGERYSVERDYVIDKSGNPIKLCKDYCGVKPLGGGLFARYNTNSLFDYSYKIVDENDNQVFQKTYDRVKPLDGELFAIGESIGAYNYKIFNRDGEQIIPDIYIDVSVLGPNIYCAKPNLPKVTVINKNGERLNGFYYYYQEIYYNHNHFSITADTPEELKEKLCLLLTEIKTNLYEITSQIDEQILESSEKSPLQKVQK